MNPSEINGELELEPFTVLFSIDIIVSVKKNCFDFFTETTMPMENKTANGSSLKCKI